MDGSPSSLARQQSAQMKALGAYEWKSDQLLSAKEETFQQ